MTQILLRSNRRFGATIAIVLLPVSIVTATFAVTDVAVWIRVASGLAFAVTLPMIWLCWQFCTHPRLALNDEELLVYVNKLSSPIRVPLDVVEVFFIGQGAVHGSEPGQPKEYDGAVAANVIVRLAEAANDWHHRDVNLWLSVWDDGYITIRGLWSENIDQTLLKKMNRTLLDVKRRRRGELAARPNV